MADHENNPATPEKVSQVAVSAYKELLTADLERTEEAIWRNEDIGEKRFNFFLTIATGVGGGLVALWSSDKIAATAIAPKVTEVSVLLLLTFGLITYIRLVHRDKITAEYKLDTKTTRKALRELIEAEFPAAREYGLVREKRPEQNEVRRRFSRIGQMGYTQTVALLDGILLGTSLTFTPTPRYVAIPAGVMCAALLCFYGAKSHKPTLR